jgi:hypothetical protein
MKQRLKKNENNDNDNDNIDNEKKINDNKMEEIHLQQDVELQNNNFARDFYNFILYSSKYLYKTIKFIINISGLYIIWIILHYTASHLYIKLCVPNTVIGFLMSPFMTATPHCQGLRWLIYNAAIMINNMWVLFGAWICSTLLFVNSDTKNGDRN